MNKIIIALPILALLTLGAIFIINKYETHHLTNSSNQTTFTQMRTCIENISYIICDDIQDDVEKQLCYAASYGVSRFTFSDGDKLLDSCKNFIQYEASAQASQMINYENYYFSCFLNAEVLKQAYQSKTYYEKIYEPRQITCAGY